MSTKADLYLDFLGAEGYRPTRDDDGDVLFKFEGGTYLIYAVEDDPTYFRVVYPNFWPIESDDERARALDAASLASRQCKGAKVYVRDDGANVSVAYEAFYDDVARVQASFTRILSAMRHAARTFADAMHAGASDV